MFKNEIVEVVSRILGKKKEEIESLIEVPPDQKLGDFALPCFVFAKEIRKSPLEIAKDLENKVKMRVKFFKEVKTTGPYLNFFIDENKFTEYIIDNIANKKEKYSVNKSGRGKKILIEYSQPNPNKPMHIGHLRNDTLGMALVNLFERNSYKVVKTNLINDRGIHICKVMLAYQKWAKGKKPNKKPDHFIGDLYVLYSKNETSELEKETQDLLKKWEEKDKKTTALWKKLNSWAIKGIKETYKEFGSKFDYIFYESQFYDKAKQLIKAGLEMGVFFKDDTGAIFANLEPELPNKVVLRGDGTSVYMTNDLALTEYKFNRFKPDKLIWCVASEQNLYFKQLFKVFEKLEHPLYPLCEHFPYGMVNLPSGKMKSREGTVIDADDILKELRLLAEKETRLKGKVKESDIKKISRLIALGAIKFYLSKAEANKDILFEADKAVSFDGETGPYIQYSCTRINSILKKGKTSRNRALSKKIDYSLLKEEREFALIKGLSLYPEIIEKATGERKPHIVSNYVYQLAQTFNNFYVSCQCITDNKKLTEARLKLIAATLVVLKDGLNVLGIEAPENM